MKKTVMREQYTSRKVKCEIKPVVLGMCETQPTGIMFFPDPPDFELFL